MGELFCFKCVPRWIWAVGVLAFLSTTVFAAWRFKAPPKPPPPPPQRIDPYVIFHVYDMRGKPLEDAYLYGTTDEFPRLKVYGDLSHKTLPIGAKRTLTVEYNGEKQSVDVIWRDPDQYKAWLSKDLPAMLAAMDPAYDKDAWTKIARRISSEVTPTKYEYPIAFHSKR